jgi:hypothetical protein
MSFSPQSHRDTERTPAMIAEWTRRSPRRLAVSGLARFTVWSTLALCFCVSVVGFGQAQTNLGPIKNTTQDTIGQTSAPANPGSGLCRGYYNTTTGVMTWINSSGGSCSPTGGGGGSVGPGTIGYFAGFVSSTTNVADVPCNFSGLNVYCLGNLTLPSDGTHAAALALIGNTLPPTTLPTNDYFGFIGPNSASFGSYFFQANVSAPTNGRGLLFGPAGTCIGSFATCIGLFYESSVYHTEHYPQTDICDRILAAIAQSVTDGYTHPLIDARGDIVTGTCPVNPGTASNTTGYDIYLPAVQVPTTVPWILRTSANTGNIRLIGVTSGTGATPVSGISAAAGFPTGSGTTITAGTPTVTTVAGSTTVTFTQSMTWSANSFLRVYNSTGGTTFYGPLSPTTGTPSFAASGSGTTATVAPTPQGACSACGFMIEQPMLDIGSPLPAPGNQAYNIEVSEFTLEGNNLAGVEGWVNMNVQEGSKMYHVTASDTPAGCGRVESPNSGKFEVMGCSPATTYSDTLGYLICSTPTGPRDFDGGTISFPFAGPHPIAFDIEGVCANSTGAFTGQGQVSIKHQHIENPLIFYAIGLGGCATCGVSSAPVGSVNKVIIEDTTEAFPTVADTMFLISSNSPNIGNIMLRGFGCEGASTSNNTLIADQPDGAPYNAITCDSATGGGGGIGPAEEGGWFYMGETPASGLRTIKSSFPGIPDQQQFLNVGQLTAPLVIGPTSFQYGSGLPVLYETAYLQGFNIGSARIYGWNNAVASSATPTIDTGFARWAAGFVCVFATSTANCNGSVVANGNNFVQSGSAGTTFGATTCCSVYQTVASWPTGVAAALPHAVDCNLDITYVQGTAVPALILGVEVVGTYMEAKAEIDNALTCASTSCIPVNGIINGVPTGSFQTLATGNAPASAGTYPMHLHVAIEVPTTGGSLTIGFAQSGGGTGATVNVARDGDCHWN